jgi:transcription initiation factor IIE alpha subunit
MQKINFICPKCNSHILEELTENCVIVNRVKNIAVDNSGSDAEYEQIEILGDDAFTSLFRCGECEMVLKDHEGVEITTLTDATKWIERTNRLTKTGE